MKTSKTCCIDDHGCIKIFFITKTSFKNDVARLSLLSQSTCQRKKSEQEKRCPARLQARRRRAKYHSVTSQYGCILLHTVTKPRNLSSVETHQRCPLLCRAREVDKRLAEPTITIPDCIIILSCTNCDILDYMFESCCIVVRLLLF